MAEFLTTNGTSYHIEDIILKAQKELTLLSPYLQLSKTFYERLLDCSNNGVKITVIYGKDELKPNEKKSLAELPTLELFFFENLHAKCFYNESTMVITSMNMYEFSEKNNREMGVLVNANNDKNLYENAVKEALSIKRSADVISLNRKTKQKKERNQKNITRGYCIRCEKRIEYNPDKPLCQECYKTWSFFENPEFEENVCHGCGKFETTSVARPQCNDCWNSNGRYISKYSRSPF